MSDFANRIKSAFTGPRDFRTVGGVARQVKLDPIKVRSFIAQHPDLFEQATITLGGEPVYALREQVPYRDMAHAQ